MGIMPTLINKLNETKTLRPILLILHALCQEALCVSAMAQIPNSIGGLKVRKCSKVVFYQFLAMFEWKLNLRNRRRSPLSSLQPRLLRVDCPGDWRRRQPSRCFAQSPYKLRFWHFDQGSNRKNIEKFGCRSTVRSRGGDFLSRFLSKILIGSRNAGRVGNMETVQRPENGSVPGR